MKNIQIFYEGLAAIFYGVREDANKNETPVGRRNTRLRSRLPYTLTNEY